jgi:hypothetical protein
MVKAKAAIGRSPGQASAGCPAKSAPVSPPPVKPAKDPPQTGMMLPPTGTVLPPQRRFAPVFRWNQQATRLGTPLAKPLA